MDFSFVPTVAAATPILDMSASYTTTDMLRITISLIVVVAMLCAVVFCIWWGLMLILSWWNDGKVKSAIGSIRYSIIGIIVIVVAILIIPRISELLGFGSMDYLSPKSIFETIQVLMNRIFGTSSATNFDSLDF